MVVRLAGLALLLALPLAAGALPPAAVTDPEAEIISRHAYYHYGPDRVCVSDDPVVGLASTALTSRLAHASEGGATTFQLHLDGVPGDAACPAVDLEFTLPLAYPGTPYGTFVPFTATCGASGYLGIYERDARTVFSFGFTNPEGACGLAGGYLTGGFDIAHAVGGPALVCAPVVVPGCAGVAERVPEQTHGECDGQTSTTAVTVYVDLVYAQRQCQPWNDGRDHVTVRDGFFGFVTLDATERSCEVREGFTGSEVACPAELGPVLLGIDWGSILS